MAASGAVSRVMLVDDAVDVARGKALDIRQSGAIEAIDAEVAGSADLGAVVGAAASSWPTATRPGAVGVDQGDDGLQLLARVRALNPRALIVCAGASAARPRGAHVHERGADRRRLVGSAPEALRSGRRRAHEPRVRVRAARRLADADRPAAAPGAFVPWNDAAIGGQPRDRRARSRRRWRASTADWRASGRRARWRWGGAGRVVRLALVGGPGSACVFAVPAGPGSARGAERPCRSRSGADGLTSGRAAVVDARPGAARGRAAALAARSEPLSPSRRRRGGAGTGRRRRRRGARAG